MSLRQLVEQAGFDWKDAYFIWGSGTSYRSSFSIKPEEFIAFAKADVFRADLRGLINGLSNAKRAVDCQADAFVQALGLDSDRLDKQLGPAGMASLAASGGSKDGPVKFRFLEALGVATPEIVGRMRRLRNVLEHEYRKPKKKEVKDAIVVAELFVQACGGLMANATHEIGFGSGRTSVRGDTEVAKVILLRFHPEPVASFEAVFWDREFLAANGSAKYPEVLIGLKEPEFFPLLKLMWKARWDADMTVPLWGFLAEIGIKVPKRGFRVKDGDCL